MGNVGSYKTAVLLCMGIDKSDGQLSLNDNGHIDLDWPYKNSLSLYKGILAAGKQFRKATKAKQFLPLPTWLFKRNVTVHPLGGAYWRTTPARVLPAPRGPISARFLATRACTWPTGLSSPPLWAPIRAPPSRPFRRWWPRGLPESHPTPTCEAGGRIGTSASLLADALHRREGATPKTGASRRKRHRIYGREY